MTYVASAALQSAVYQCLREDPGVTALVGDAIFDAMPVDAPGGVHIAIGPEDVSALVDSSGAAARHDFVVSVLSGTDEGVGFRAVKEAAVAVASALEAAELETAPGHVAGLWFLKARAKRVEQGAERRVDLTFRALIDLA